jgi:endoglucanase
MGRPEPLAWLHVRMPAASLLALLAIAPAAAAQTTDPRGVDPAQPNPLLGTAWQVPQGDHPAWRQYLRYVRQGKHHRAALAWRIAGEPKFAWFGRFSRPKMPVKVRRYIDSAAPGTIPLLAVIRHQGNDCGPHYRAGGEAQDRRTMRWYDVFAHTVGSSRVVIAFEPDSLGTVECLARDRRRDRLDVLRHGVDVLSQLPNATIYLEGGASDWEGARRTARQLNYIGIHKVRGFMLNVTHYDWTAANIRHGLDISSRVGGKPFIINTATNGRGPVHYRNARRRVVNVWCHPLMRGLGIPPTTATHHPKVDAYMWVNRPGYSGGSCNGGPLPVGSWWPLRALSLARYQTGWIRPPKGTRFGLYSRPSLAEVAGEGLR